MLLNKGKESRVKFNPGLSANSPSNNWAQIVFTISHNQRRSRDILAYEQLRDQASQPVKQSNLLLQRRTILLSNYTVVTSFPEFCKYHFSRLG